MGNYNLTNHIAEDHIHTDKTCNIEEPQQKYRLGTVGNRLPGVLNFPYKINPKNLEPSYKTDLDFWDCLGK